MALPPMSPEQRAEGLLKAKAANAERAALKAKLKSGSMTLAEAITAAEASRSIAKIKVSALLQALPGIGKVKAEQVMARIGIDPNRRVGGLGTAQRAALEQEFATADA